MSDMQHGKFITFEGGEGSGKTTQSKRLYEKLLANGINAVWTYEIGGTEIANLIRNIVLFKDMSLTTELLLIMAARSDHIEKVILPQLQESKWIICDRFIDSTLCYQCQDEQDMRLVLQLHKTLFNNILPDLTFNISVSPNIAMERVQLRARKKNDSNINKFDRKDLLFYCKIVDLFSRIYSLMPNRIIVQIDGNAAIEEVHLQITNVIQERAHIKLSS